jgi:hypothetical protein
MRRLKCFLRRVLVVNTMMLQARVLRVIRRPAEARRVLQRVIRLVPASFKAHFLMGWLALTTGRRAEAIQEFGICHRLDSDRLASSSVPLVLKRLAVTRFRGAPEAPYFEVAGRPVAGEWEAAAGGGTGVASRGAPRHTDFATAAEFARFKDLPPIQAEDLADVDMDALLAMLARNPHPGTTRED